MSKSTKWSSVCEIKQQAKYLKNQSALAFQLICMPWSLERPAFLPLGTWPQWEQEQRQRYPLRWRLFDPLEDWLLHRIPEAIHSAIWRCRYRWHPGYRYHLVDTELKPGWHPTQTCLLYAMMALLERYRRLPLQHDPDTLDAIPVNVQADIERLHRWWTIDYPGYEARVQCAGSVIGARATEINRQEDEIDEMLIRLIRIRRYLAD